jgi:hypothetical protein
VDICGERGYPASCVRGESADEYLEGGNGMVRAVLAALVVVAVVGVIVVAAAVMVASEKL